jgi:dihydroorotate dehydrogenase
MPDSVHAQAIDGMLVTNHTVVGHSPETTQGLVSGAASYSISLLMLNAVSTQYSGSQIAEAAVVSSCAGILKAAAKAVG